MISDKRVEPGEATLNEGRQSTHGPSTLKGPFDQFIQCENRSKLKEPIPAQISRFLKKSHRERVRCPRCAGRKLEESKSGSRYICRECDNNFDNPLVTPSCPKCGSNKAVSRKAKPRPLSGGRIWVALKCYSCGAQFLLHQEFKHKRHPLRVYAYAIYYLLKGLSLEDVRNGLKQFENTEVSAATLHNWVSDWIVNLAPYLLSLKLDTSGIVYLDEMMHPIRHRSRDGRKYSEEVWQWNSWDPGKKTRLVAKLARNRDAEIACQVILQTLKRIRIPLDGVTLWCDGLTSYKTAYQRLVESGRLNPNQVKMISTPKTAVYSIINEIEGVNMRWRHDVDEKLKITDSLENAERRLQGLIVLHDFIDPRKEFSGKSAALNARAELDLGPNDTEALVRLSNMLKAERLRKFDVPAKHVKEGRASNSVPSQTRNLLAFCESHES